MMPLTAEIGLKVLIVQKVLGCWCWGAEVLNVQSAGSTHRQYPQRGTFSTAQHGTFGTPSALWHQHRSTFCTPAPLAPTRFSLAEMAPK